MPPRDPSAGPKPGTYQQWRQVQPDSVARVPVDRPMVALTFDDGPDPRYTREVLRLLRANDARATFFTIGVNAAAYPSFVHEVMADGHSIGNHTWNHRLLDSLTADEVAEEIDRCQAALAGVGAPTPHLFRPPKGFTAPDVGPAADRAGLRTVFWDECVEHLVDHQDLEVGVVELLGRAQPGSIILAHDGGAVVGSPRRPLSRERTIAALPSLLSGLRSLGLEVVDVPTLMKVGRVPMAPGHPDPDLLR